ncbi:AAA family ATPase [Myxococcus eversor]|uniref:AAA family ATPase n=1 Tax=Myxococcus eversor TaxID=2709661 RepID=UPI0013D383E1|nr:AAA family ATPase [Myxococcus eversor]
MKTAASRAWRGRSGPDAWRRTEGFHGEDAMWQAPGTEGLQEIHRGRRYVVLRTWGQDGKPLVIKQIRRGPLAAGTAPMLRHEEALLRELRDVVPDISRVVSLVEEPSQPLALMLEDAGPHNLQEWLRRKPVGVEVFMELALQLGGILSRLHQQHVIHRDLNPTNLVMSASGHHLTLIDFDLATRVSGLTPSGDMPGELQWALPYIAPEQTGRMNRLIDHRADLYSLGATFYELLTGQPPFMSADPVELVHAHLARPPVPPAFANPAVPPVVSNIVLKLLAKMPEERYQSADSLLADLQEVRRRHGAGLSGDFELGRLDLARQLTFPERLYGRAPQQVELRAARERVRQGTSELLLLSGAAGIGKSALVHELARDAAHGDRLLTGKFNQLQGTVPYSAFVQAFQGLLRELLEEAPDARDIWRQRLLGALGPHARVISDVIPALEELLGPQPLPPRLGPVESSARFHLLFQSFVQALATPRHVLVVFLDDLQWADPGSLQLLKSLCGDPGSLHVLFIGAWRSHEVGPEHPLSRLLSTLEEQGAIPSHPFALAPLDVDAITALCADTFRRAPAEVAPLAELLLAKTAGNPLFLTRLLRLLHASGLLSFDLEHGTWTWELERLRGVEVTENVVELMLAAIRRLPERAQYVLEVAACLGDRVELGLLSALVQASAEDTASALWSLLREGLLIPENEPTGLHARTEDATTPEAAYRFAHDRVRQAAYSLLTEDQRESLHLAAGRELLRGARGDALEERLFAVVDQLSLGVRKLGSFLERQSLAELLFRAGFKAKEASAFGAALVYLTRGLSLLPPADWPQRHEQIFQVHKEAAECAYLSGNGKLAEELLRTAHEHAASAPRKVDLYVLQVLALLMNGHYAEALRAGREGLLLFGLELPEYGHAQALAAERERVEHLLRGRAVEELLDAPSLEDPRHLACVQLLSELVTPAFFVDPHLFAYLNTLALALTLEHGNSRWAPSVYACQGLMLASEDNPTAAWSWCHLAVALARRMGDARQECRALITLTLNVNHWRAPLRTSLSLLRRAVTTGLASGDLQFTSYALSAVVSTELAMGTELVRVLGSIDTSLSFARRAGVQVIADVSTLTRQAIRALQGRTHQLARLEDDDFNERDFIASGQAAQTSVYLHALLRLLVAYVLGDFDEALRMSREALPYEHFAQGSFRNADFNLLTSLTLAARATRLPAEKDSMLGMMDDNQRRLGAWARTCPENFRHKHQLVAAEMARLEGQPLEAMRLYESAIDGAHTQGFLQDEALANELAGRFHQHLHHKRFATLHLRAALDCYTRWGAQAKVALLEEEFPELKSLVDRAWSEPGVTRTSPDAPGASLDLLTLLKASETLVGEVVLDRLLEKLMAVCFEAAGATRGALVLDEAGALRVRAVGAISEPVSLERTPLSHASQVPISLLEHAFRTGETLVLADAAHQGRFIRDAYVVRRAVKSALAVPIQRHGKTVGVLYLENDLATRAFTPERVGVLRTLSSQIAISLENSRLFEQLHVEVQERRRAERALRFLADSGLALAESLDLEQTLGKAMRLVVPFLADWCMLTVVERGDTLRTLVAVHVDPAKEVLLRELLERHPVDWTSPPALIHALRTGQPFLRAEVTDFMLHEHGHGPEYVERLRELGSRAAMHVPLIAGGKTLGVATFVSDTPGRRYNEVDVGLAQELARRVAASIDNARLYRESQDAIRLRDEFLSVASHELNTPLTSLRLMVQTLLRHTPQGLPPVAIRGLRTLDSQSLKLATLVEEMLDISRLQAGRLDLHLSRVDLREVIDAITRRLQEPLERAGCELGLDLEGGPLVGHWDAARLRQVLVHLLSNALKFGPGKPITLRAWAVADVVHVSVQDQGIGIAADRLAHIFERFERAVSVRAYGGLGLGLHLVRELVTALGGTLHVESTLGEGSTFSVELPTSGPADTPA